MKSVFSRTGAAHELHGEAPKPGAAPVREKTDWANPLPRSF
jgi:hypothetical protein